MIEFSHKGNFEKTFNFFKRTKKISLSDLDKFGKKGVEALVQNTPIDTGTTALSWSYQITERDGSIVIEWLNSNIQNGIPIALLIQYDHATGTGGYVYGQDYINPAIRPIFDAIAENAWKELTKK